MKSSSFPVAMVGLLLATVAVAQAPSTPRPAAAPAGGNTLNIGGASARGGPVLTRDELRACFKNEESIRTRLATQTAARGPLDTEKQSIAADQQALRAERAPVEDIKKRSEEFAAKVKQFGVRVQDWTARVEAHNAAKPSAVGYEKEGDDLNRERAAIAKERTDYEAERAALAAESAKLVTAYNAKAREVDARVQAWNKRNAEWNETSAALEAERQDWVVTCAGRRYREDDEEAIRRGQ